MTINDPQFESNARIVSLVAKQTILFATLGLVTQLFILWLMGFSGFLQHLDQLLAGVVGTYLAAGILGVIAGQVIYRHGTHSPLIWLVAVGAAWICLLVSTLSGSSVEFLHHRSEIGAFGDYIVKPAFWFMFLGTIPAILFGIGYGVRIKHLIGLACPNTNDRFRERSLFRSRKSKLRILK